MPVAYLLALLSLFAVLEFLRPARTDGALGERRWLGNFGLLLLNRLPLPLYMPLLAGVIAAAVEPQGGGLSAWNATGLAGLLPVIAGVLLVDLVTYGMHRLQHNWGPLWRLHLPHHSDTEIDFSTTERHHPLETLLMAAVIVVTVRLFSIPDSALLAYVALHTPLSIASHANLAWPLWLERPLAWLIVTPRFHLIHHSAHKAQTNSHYGQVFTVWDRLFRTARPIDEPVARYGLEYLRAPREQRLDRLLLQPFHSLAVLKETASARERQTPEAPRTASEPRRVR